MTECEEVADSIWRARAKMKADPIRTYADAERVARHWCRGEGAIITRQIADALYDRAQKESFR